MSWHQLFAGLTVRRILGVTAVCGVAAALGKAIFINPVGEVLLLALCVGYASMVLFTIASNLSGSWPPREIRQVAAIVVGSVFGTLLANFLRGRDLADLFHERLWGWAMSMGLGIGFGCVIVAGVSMREKHARDAARIARAESERHQAEKNVLEARLQLMQAQVEPHFLFNTLANVQHWSRPIRPRRRACWRA
jgi:hypothetical protein